VAQIEQELRARMAHGVLGAGMRLPSIRGLADARGVSPNTVIEAYERLRAQGLVRSRQGSGYFVQEPPSPSPPSAGGALMPQQAEDVAGELWQLFSDAPHTLKLGCGWLPESFARPHIAAGRLVEKRTQQARPVDPLQYGWRRARRGKALSWWLSRLEVARVRKRLLLGPEHAH
ncbi:MAG TPA: GntR family transcriptional regulator, partial [Quisquiliibacterium sp.]|nr:GntR family transcriptional regulator [Quisquiliibacterium sp.]